MEKSKSIHKPDWFYESLPYVYAAIGVGVIAALPDFFGVLSGLMLMSAGAAVYFMRRAYRREIEKIRAEESSRQQSSVTEDDEELLVALVWRKAYESGIPEIDVQHRALFDMGNELLSRITSNRPSSEILNLLENLVEDIDLHFRTEESMQFSLNCPNAIAHKRVHDELWSRTEQLLDGYRNHTLGIRDIFGFIAYDLIAMHMATEDRKIFNQPKAMK